MARVKLNPMETSPFLFDVNFAAPEPPEPKVVVPEEPVIPTIEVREHEALLKQAEAQAHHKGVQQGIAQAQATEEKRLADGVQRVAAATQKILAAIDDERKTLEAEAANLALSIAFKLAEKALQNYPLSDIEALISESLAPLRKTPHLLVRLHEQDVEVLTETVGKLAREKGFEGRFVVLGEPDFQRGDCRIEWADGGILRDRNKAQADLTAIFQNYFDPVEILPLTEEDNNEPLITKEDDHE